jgi:TonB family protein
MASVAQADTAEPQIVCDRCDVSYPEEARLSGLNGQVNLLIDIDADGRVTNAYLSRSSGYSILDQHALETARTWQFQPIPGGATGLPVVIDYVTDDGILEEP